MIAEEKYEYWMMFLKMLINISWLKGWSFWSPLEVPATHALHSARFRDVPSEEELEEHGFGEVQEPELEIRTYIRISFSFVHMASIWCVTVFFWNV